MIVRFALALLLCWAFVTGAALADEQWLLVTDIHLNPFDPRDYPAPPGRDTNMTLFNSAMAEMQHVIPHPSMVLLGGDFLTHHFPERSRGYHGSGAFATKDALATMKTTAFRFDRAYPNAHFAVVLGNNDDPCGDYRSEFGDTYMAALARIWKPLVDRDGAAPDFVRTFSQGGYSVVPALHRRAQIMALNSVYWSFFYRGACSRLPVNPGLEERAWMQRTLAATPENVRTIVLSHVPPGVDATSTITARRFIAVPFLHPSDDRVLAQTFAKYNDRIAWAIVGHAHRNDFRLLGGVPVLLAASISPVYRNEPEFFILDVGDDGSLHDIETYAYDDERDAWDREPSFDAAWNVKGFTADALRSIHDRLAVDPNLRASWADRYTGWGWRIDDINEGNWRIYWCAQTDEGESFSKCSGTAGRLAKLVAVAVTFAVVFVAVVVLAVWTTRRYRRSVP
jgi:hypothetical protein